MLLRLLLLQPKRRVLQQEGAFLAAPIWMWLVLSLVLHRVSLRLCLVAKALLLSRMLRLLLQRGPEVVFQVSRDWLVAQHRVLLV